MKEVIGKKEKTEDWSPKGLISEKSIDSVIKNLGHFTFKLSHSNAISGGLLAEKVELDGYVSMSTIMSGHEYELMHNPGSQAKILRRINAVIEGKELELFKNVSNIDVEYIKESLNTIDNSQNLNLDTPNKRLKQIIIQEKGDKEVKNKELIILRSSGFAKILAKELKKEKEEGNSLTRRKAQMSFGGANPINIGVNGYLMSNVLYFDAPLGGDKNTSFNEAYKIHHSGIKLYDLISVEFLKSYYEYQSKLSIKNRINSYWNEKEKQLIIQLFNDCKSIVSKKYKLLETNKESFSNGEIFSDDLLSLGKEDKLLAFYMIKKFITKDADEKLINCLVSILKSKTFYIEKKATNLLLSNDNIFNIKKTLRELLWQNI